MSFCTAINCMDGRVQLPVIAYLQERFGVEYVDVVSEPGPVGILSSQPDSETTQSIFRRVDASIRAHQSRGIAVVAHHDCAGNPVPEEQQKKQLQASVRLLADRYPNMEVIALWLGDTWSVQ